MGRATTCGGSTTGWRTCARCWRQLISNEPGRRPVLRADPRFSGV
jgi:hypothetical protein